ncbi:MAG: hypothetical protein NC935_01355 [Candidatus Omnitrophica bacterium]|nr:hypothetical protein [Candidatus Omnitrophota bacterium]
MEKRGFTLIFIIFVVVVLGILSLAMLSRSIWEANVAKKNLDSVKAFWLAEAGISKAIEQLHNDFNDTAPINITRLGEGGYNASLEVLDNQNRTVEARGFIPFYNPTINRLIQVNVRKYQDVPSNFYDNAIYSAGDIFLKGSSYTVNGNVTYALNITGDTSNINGTISYNSSIRPLVHFNFDQLKNISISQGNYNLTSDNFPSSFWYNETAGIPNVIFLEGNLVLKGNQQVGGFYVVGGEVVCDATLAGTVGVEGAIYTLGNFTIKGGGAGLNIVGGVWAGEKAILDGNAKVFYNSTYMHAIDNLDVDTDVQITSWKELQSPYEVK